MAVFRKTRGTARALRLGDEFLVRMPGPWDGPVRVVRRDPPRSGSPPWTAIWRQAKSSSGPSRTATPSASRSNLAGAAVRPLALPYNSSALSAKRSSLNMWSHSVSGPAPGGGAAGCMTI